MRLTVFADERALRAPDGTVWTLTAHGYDSWRRHLDTFAEVEVVARVRSSPQVPTGWRRADGPGVSYRALPHYQGPWQFLRVQDGLRRAVRGAAVAAEAVLLRAPSTAATLAFRWLQDRPYGVQVIGDPRATFAPGAVATPLRRFFRAWYTRHLRRQCARACAASYVTDDWLQRWYPCPGLSIGVSDVDLRDAALVDRPRVPSVGRGARTLITVGTLDQLYKAPDLLIDAVAACVGQGEDLRLVLVGDGRHRGSLEERAAARGVRERVVFRGMVAPEDAVRAELDRADLFVLPSKADATPKALLEAMARALPCIGSTIGGIPELLAPEDLVAPGSVPDLSAKILEVVTTPARMALMSARNLRRANDFRPEVLQPRRLTFDRHLRERTEAWLSQRR